MSSGKTRFGKRLAKALGLKFLDLDQVIFARTQRSAADWIRQEGEEPFRKIELLCLLHCIEQEDFVLATGGGTPCFLNNMERMNKSGVTIWMKVPLARILQRLQNSKGDRPMITMKDGVPDNEAVAKHYTERLPFYQAAKIILTDCTVEEAVNAVRGLLINGKD